MRLNKINNESGIVMVIVICFIVIMSVAMVGLFVRNTSTALTSVEQAKRIKADTLARGAYWRAYNLLSTGQSLPVGPESETFENTVYRITYSQVTNQVNVAVNY